MHSEALVRDHTMVRDHTIYSCVMGSRAFGLATDASDTDRRGVFLAPTPLFWRFEKPPTHVEGPAEEQFSWELERFCTLALRANPNILECLHSPLVESVDDTGRELLALRAAFLSRRAHETFARYALGQRKKLEADVRAHGAPRWKHAMHLLRLVQQDVQPLHVVLHARVGDVRRPVLPLRLRGDQVRQIRGRPDLPDEGRQIGLYFAAAHQFDAGEQHAERVEQRLEFVRLLEQPPLRRRGVDISRSAAGR
jgi:hypothetical protein